jgi:UDP-3-O-[3-hydroxymyristoyl] glucosamine N-acyltransferase
MPDPRFFPVNSPLSLAEVAAFVGAELPAGTDAMITGCAPLGSAGPGDICFVEGVSRLKHLSGCDATACLIDPALLPKVPADTGLELLPVKAPKLAYARLLARFYPAPAACPGIAPSAHVHPEARISAGCEIGPGAVIGAGVHLGKGTIVGALAVIGEHVETGPDCRIGAQVTISHARLGAGVIMHPGTRIGQPGFGYVPGPTGMEPLPQLGLVVIGNDVELGANCTIDRGPAEDTIIGDGCKFDNGVHIAHGCRIGAHCVIAAQTGISGSSTIGQGCKIGGQVGIVDHVTIGAGAKIVSKSGVIRPVAPGATVAGIPARPFGDFLEETVLLSALRRKRAVNPGPSDG